MSHRRDIEAILGQVDGWPPEDRVALAYQILRDMRIKVLADPPRQTFERALGIGRGSGPAPTDEQVRQWVDEYRTRKYGT